MDTKEPQKALEQGSVLIQMPLHSPEFQELLLSALMKESVEPFPCGQSHSPQHEVSTDKRPSLALGCGTFLPKPTTIRHLQALPALVRTAPHLSLAAPQAHRSTHIRQPT